MAVGTVAVWAVFHFVKPLKSFAILLALVVVTAVVAIARVDVETVGDIASISNSLPPLTVPNFAVMPELLVGGVAVALVALAQAAGISAAVPNPDGSRSNMSGDFTAQGAANLAGGFFGALPAGGSLSRTGVATSAGAQTRWAGIFAGIWLALLVLIAGSAAEIIPMPVIGGLIFVIGLELVAGRLPDIKLVLRVAPISAVAMLITFAATTQLPLHTAILIGVITSLVLYCVKARSPPNWSAFGRPTTATSTSSPYPSNAQATTSPSCTTRGLGCSPRWPASTRSGRRWQAPRTPSWCSACG